MIGLPGGVKQRGADVLRFKKGVVAQDFLVRGTRGEQLEQIHHAEAGATDARASATFAGFEGDSCE